MVVVLLGPPGVGKGTQGTLLATDNDWRHLSTGDLLRSHRKQGTELGRSAQAYMDRGELVPDALILDLVRGTLTSLALGAGVVLDGFPRTEAQARSLDPVLAEVGRRVDLVVVLEADDDVIVQRLSGRRSCPRCGAVYNLQSNPPVKEGICDRCGGELVQRGDDRPETIRRRLEVYQEETEPLVRYYDRSPSEVIKVPGDGSVEEVRSDIAARVRAALEQA